MKTGLIDVNCNEIKLGDKVKFTTGHIGKIVFECGAFGIGSCESIDYDKIQDTMDKLDICCGNKLSGCLNDNFVSLREIYWNFNYEEGYLYPVEIIKEEIDEEIIR